MIERLSSNGQLTIPNTIRQELKLRTGHRFQVLTNENGTIELIPLKGSLKELKGILGVPDKPVSLQDIEKAIGNS